MVKWSILTALEEDPLCPPMLGTNALTVIPNVSSLFSAVMSPTFSGGSGEIKRKIWEFHKMLKENFALSKILCQHQFHRYMIMKGPDRVR